MFRWSVLVGLTAAPGVALLWLSRSFEFGLLPIAEKPVEALVLLLTVMGLGFLLFARRLLARGIARQGMMLAVCIGLLLRALMFFSTPILETDFYRYLWDGAVLAQGENPYVPVPSEVQRSEGRLAELAAESGIAIHRVNHPWLRTIYPPVAQAFFALSYWMSPWSLGAWRAVLLVADAATLVLLLLVLRAARLPDYYALLYWLNPLVLKEIHNSAHMDVLLAPFLLGALLLAHRGWLVSAMLCLVAATGVKIWPVLLLPLLLRASGATLPRAALAASLYGGLVAIIHIPVLLAGLDSSSGFTAYAGGWEMNNGPYLVLLWIGGLVSSIESLAISKRVVATALSIAILVVAILLTFRRPVAGLEDLSGRALAIMATLFLISPAQFPWYAMWFLPLLAIRPHMALLFYTLTLPLYYMRFRYDALGLNSLFDNVFVWVEHGPVLILLAAAKWKPQWIPPNPASLAAQGQMSDGVLSLQPEAR